MSKKKDSFSFDNDPGKISDKEDVEFTFSDIPVLGNEKKKNNFSLDQIADQDQDQDQKDPTIASFEALLNETPSSNDDIGEETQQEENISAIDDAVSNDGESDRVNELLLKKKKSKKVLYLGIAGIGLFFIITSVVVLLLVFSSEEKEVKEKKLTPEEKAAIEAKKRQKKIADMIASAKSLSKAGETERALASYKNILRLDRKLSEAHTGCGKCYEKLEKINEAKVSYQKAIDTGTKSPSPFTSLASILIKEGKLNKAVSLLELAKTKFSSNSNIFYLLGDCYYNLGKTEKAVENYRKVPKEKLNKESFIKFGLTLKKEQSNEEAKKLYTFGGKKFKEFNFFLEAVNATENKKEQIEILTDAANVLANDKNTIDEIKYLLAKAFLEDGNKREALETLNDLNISQLDKKYCTQLIKLATEAGMKDIEEFSLRILTSYPDDIKLQTAVQSDLKSLQPPETMLDIYSNWCLKNPDKASANFLYGTALGNTPSAKKYFKKAIMINPSFYEAYIQLAKIEINGKNFNQAIMHLQKAIDLKKEEKEPKRLLAIANIRKGRGTDAIRDYAIYLSKQRMPESQKVLELFELSLLLPTSSSANKYLAAIKADESLKMVYKKNNARKKLIFGGASDSDFSGQKDSELRQYYIIYLLSKGRFSDVMKVPTPREEYPDFWKIYIMRKKNLAWEKTGQKYLEKKKETAAPVFIILMSLWLQKITIEEAEKQINRISPNSKGLFLAMLAEEYIRQKNYPSANIRIRKALSSPQSIYNGLIKQIYRKSRLK